MTPDCKHSCYISKHCSNSGTLANDKRFGQVKKCYPDCAASAHNKHSRHTLTYCYHPVVSPHCRHSRYGRMYYVNSGRTPYETALNIYDPQSCFQPLLYAERRSLQRGYQKGWKTLEEINAENKKTSYGGSAPILCEEGQEACQEESTSVVCVEGENACQQESMPVIYAGYPVVEEGDTQWNEAMKNLVIGIVSKVPYAGMAINVAFNFFWPKPEADPFYAWNQIKQYIINYVSEIISEERVRNLELQLQGIRNVIEEYDKTSFGTVQKGQWFSSILSSIANAEPFFLDTQNPEKTLPHFTSMATIALTVLREQYLFYEKIYMQQDIDKAAHLATLQKKISQYKQAAMDAKKKATDWRLSLITLTKGKGSRWTIKDSHISDKTTQKPDFEYQIALCEPYELAEYIYNNRVMQVKADFENRLDAFLLPTYVWRYLDPTNEAKPTEKTITFVSGQYGGRNGDAFADDPQGKPITSIKINQNTRVAGIEFCYGGRYAGVHGTWWGENVVEYPLQSDEYIVSAEGRAGDAVDAIAFKTNKGRTFGNKYAGGGGFEWVAVPPKELNARLVSISGKQAARNLQGITLHWGYQRME